jgi:hypothetical protein
MVMMQGLFGLSTLFAMDYEFVKIAVFSPVSHAKKVRDALSDAGAGHIGKYDCCSFSARGIGRFRPLKGSKPFIGKPGKIEEVEEEKIEVICPIKILEKVLKAVKKVHPYEEPAIDVYPLVNLP